MRNLITLALGALALAAGTGTRSAAQEPARGPRTAASAPLDTLTFASLKARSIGPAIMGGRVADIALDPKDPFTFYVALARGGVMKTSDDGASWSAIFADQDVSSIGAVAVAPSDPKVVWVGTGEADDRNTAQWGDGVYRSSDGGGTWVHVGLENSRSIARIVVSPTDPNTAWVAVVGDLWQANTERGVFKTTDAGKTWRKVLSAPAPWDRDVGAGDLVADPKEPNTLYAALYARRRTAWSFTAGPSLTGGHDEGGIFKSTDGGEHWTKLTAGLPTETRRIGLAASASKPGVVYAIVESEQGGPVNIDEVHSRAGGVFRSDDGGAHWVRQSPLDPRPFYFSQIRVDPTNDQKVYVLGEMLAVSEDGGRSWREDRFAKVHPDNHALAIDPAQPQRLVLGTDGGVYESKNGGAGWAHLNTFTAGAYYRIVADSGSATQPYRLCGGLQDNQNWIGPSAVDSKNGILNQDWTDIEGGDGFYCVFGKDPNYVFTESQGASIYRFDLRDGQTKYLQPSPAEGQPAYRFNWDSPLIPSVHDADVMYLGGNRVFRLSGNGERSRAISPDLSTQNVNRILATGSGAETYGVVYALAESPRHAGWLWAGTDDGKLWVTRDEGEHWTDLTTSLPREARGEWIMRIEPSHFADDVAYLAVSAFRDGNYAPLLYRTTDGGRSWRSIAANLPAREPMEVIREDPWNPDLLFAGTEGGLYVSQDQGGHWARFGGLPRVAVDDVLLHSRTHDLAIATHGRSLYIVDDIRPLEQLTPAIRAQAAHLFPPQPATAMPQLPGNSDWDGNAVFRGENPPQGAHIDYWVREYTGAPVKIAITSPEGAPVANLTAPGVPGVHRLIWDLMPTQDVLTPYGGEGKKFVRAGTYNVSMTYGDVSQKATIQVSVAPGVETR